MKRITQEVERKLLNVLEKVAEYTASGMSPNAAIIKAGESRLRPGEVELVVHAYNVGQTNAQREAPGSLLEKTATFEGADAAVIKQQLFPEAVKTASQRAVSTIVSSDYSMPVRTVTDAMARVKLANTVWPAPETTIQKQAREKSNTKDHVKKASAIQRAEREYTRQRVNSTVAMQKLAAAVDAFGDYFRRAGGYSQPVVKAAAVRLFQPEAVERIFSTMYSSQPGIAKLASHNDCGKRVPVSAEPLQLIAAVIKQAEECTQYAATLTKLADDVRQSRAVFFPERQVAEDGTSLMDNFDKEAIASPSPAGASVFPPLLQMPGAMKDRINSAKTYADEFTNPDADIQKALRSLTDPDHEEQLRQLQAQTAFQELLAKDKILQGYDPRQTADAYGQIAQAAPNLATQPMALQALMRKKLEQGHMDTFDVNDMLSMNNNLQSRHSGMNDAVMSSPN